MLFQPCEWRSDKFVEIHPPLVDSLRRAVPGSQRARDRLFVYFALEPRTYVVGLWADEHRHYFWDVINMGPVPLFTQQDALHLRRLFGDPLTREGLRSQLYSQERQQLIDATNHEKVFAEQLAWRNARGRRTAVSFAGT